MTRRALSALLAALAALSASAKSVDDFVGVYTPPVASAAAPLRSPAAGMAVNANSLSSVGYAYDRFCGLADLMSPGFSDASDRRGADFSFASAARRREIADGSDLTAGKFDNVVAAAGNFLASVVRIQPAAGEWLTSALYCPAAADFEGSLFRSGEFATRPDGTIEGNPCCGGAAVPCLGANPASAGWGLAAVGEAFARAVDGRFVSDGGTDYTLDAYIDGDDLFEDGALARDADGAAALAAEPWLKLARLANGMNAWAAFLLETPAKFRMERTRRTRSISFTVSADEGDASKVNVDFEVTVSKEDPTAFTSAVSQRTCEMSRTAGDAPKNASGDVEIEVTGQTEAHFREKLSGLWSLVSEESVNGYTIRKFRSQSSFQRIQGLGGTTWTGGLGHYTLGTGTADETVPVAVADWTDAKLLTDAQAAYHGMGKIVFGGVVTTRRQGAAKGTDRHVIVAHGISPADGYKVSGALGGMINGYAKNAGDENEITAERARIMMEGVWGSASVRYEVPTIVEPGGCDRYRYELVAEGGGGSATSATYVGGECSCTVDGCGCGLTGLRCGTCNAAGCGCCLTEPPRDDDDAGGDVENWRFDKGDGGSGGQGGEVGEVGGVRVVTASAYAVVRIPAAGTNAYSYSRSGVSPACLVLARINSTAGGWPESLVEEPCDLYVDCRAGEGGNGSADRPFASLDDAVDAADPAKSATAQAKAAATSASGVKRIGIRRGTYAMPNLFTRAPTSEPAYPVELVGLDDYVVLRKTTRNTTGAYDDYGQPLTTLRNVTVECAREGGDHRMAFFNLENCRISGVARSNYSVVEACVLLGCEFEGLTFQGIAANGTDVAPVVFGSYASNCVFSVDVADPAVTSLAEASAVVDCLVRGGKYAALQSFGIGQGGYGGFDRCTFCPSNVLAQARAAKDTDGGSLSMADCLVFVDGFTNAPPRVADNLMTNRAAAAEMLNPVTWRPKASFREWRKKGYRSAR